MSRFTHRYIGVLLALVTALGIAGGTAPAPAQAVSLVTRWHVPVLMYHRIAPATERGHDLVDLVLDPAVFDAQLKALKANGWHTITAATLAAKMAARQPISHKTVVITLDDGREDGYTHAFPILKKYGFIATFYVITGRVGRSNAITWSQMQTMQAAGMEIGNHTVSHADMKLYTRAQTDAQVASAQKAILTNTGVAAQTFAYPFGFTYPNVVASVKAAGVKIAFTTVFGAKETMATRFLVPRVRIHPATTASGIVSLLYAYR
jgi:peptidoglycan/xylan/chitin deacetylase (PgdA/CDA1 family)